MRSPAIEILTNFLQYPSICPSLQLSMELAAAVNSHGKCEDLCKLENLIEGYYSGKETCECFRRKMEALLDELTIESVYL